MEIPPLKGEKWWGAIVGLADRMPYGRATPVYDLTKDNMNNQIEPLMISSAGRYVWSDEPFSFAMCNDTLMVSGRGEILLEKGGTTLREAYLSASGRHFPPSGKVPAEPFFSQPQYNTWIELMYDQNQADILRYAEKIVENGFPSGIFMIDDNWQRYYGNFEFKLETFPDPRTMCDRLHEMGFKVMVWICPFISPDSREFRYMNSKGYLIRDKTTGDPAIIGWWNGRSACVDVTNPQAVEYFVAQLENVRTKYGVDGFKLDAGDVHYMSGDYIFHDPEADANTFCSGWAELGLRFDYNELRTSWKVGGKELVHRLGDKDHSWDAVRELIPGMVTAGLLGLPYTCPDMIGGGQYISFLNFDKNPVDQELIVRSCQLHAMMPMMQFSVAPWRILDERHMEICRQYALLHEQMGSYILETARNSAVTGEPIVRHMEYAFPHQGFAECKDQFMLGDKYMVAPMVDKGCTREVSIPGGVWKDELGNRFRGPCRITIEVPIERLPYFEIVKQ